MGNTRSAIQTRQGLSLTSCCRKSQVSLHHLSRGARAQPRNMECSRGSLLIFPSESRGHSFPTLSGNKGQRLCKSTIFIQTRCGTYGGERTINGGQTTVTYPSLGHQAPCHRTMSKTKSERGFWGLVTLRILVSPEERWFLVPTHHLRISSSKGAGG